jgi:hypothetical protein
VVESRGEPRARHSWNLEIITQKLATTQPQKATTRIIGLIEITAGDVFDILAFSWRHRAHHFMGYIGVVMKGVYYNG